MLQFDNLDLQQIYTPVNATNLEILLKETNYDPKETEYLVNGFKNGFDLGYRGNAEVKQTSPNLKFTIGNDIELWNKVMKEVEAKRYAGPFPNIPFDNFYSITHRISA